jgi:hypothetical protein
LTYEHILAIVKGQTSIPVPVTMPRTLLTASVFILVTATFTAVPLYAQSSTPSLAIEAKASPTPTPQFGANWEFSYRADRRGVDMDFDWTSIPGKQGYALGMSKKPGQRPRERIATTRSQWTFRSVSPGTWYVNLMARDKQGIWSDVWYWTVEVPRPAVPSPTPTEALFDVERLETPVPTDILLPEGGPSEEEEGEVQSVRTKVERILEQSAKKTKKKSASAGFKCNCQKTCRSVATCSEAYYQLNTCGCVELDPDGDGIPCDNRCSEE